MQSKTSSDPVIPYDLILSLYVAYIPTKEASTFFSLCRHLNQQQNNYWEQKAKASFPKAIGNERNNAKVLGMGRKLPQINFLYEAIDKNFEYFELENPFLSMIVSKGDHEYSIGCQGNTFSLKQIAPIIWQDAPEPFFAAICDIGFTPSFFTHRGDFNSAGNRLNFYSKKAHDISLLEQDFIGFLPALIALKRVNLFTAVVKAYLFLYQDIGVNVHGASLEELHYLSFDVFFNMIVIADSKEQEQSFFIQLLLSLIFETSYAYECIIANTLQLCRDSGLTTLACAELNKLIESSNAMTNEEEKAKTRRSCEQLKAVFAKCIDNFEELLPKKKVIPVITDNKQSLLKKGFRSFVLDELDKYPEYIVSKGGFFDIENWFFWEASLVFRFKESSKQFRFHELLPIIHADDAQRFFTQATTFDASVFCLGNPTYSTQIQTLEKEEKIKPHDLGFVCFLPIMVKLDRVAIFEFLAQAYLMIYQNMPVTAFNDKPQLKFRAVFNLVKDADLEADAKGLFIQKMIGIAFKCGINKACFIWEVLDLAKQDDLLHLVKEELATNSALDIKQLEAIFKQYSLNYQQFIPEIKPEQHYKLG